MKRHEQRQIDSLVQPQQGREQPQGRPKQYVQ